MDKKKPVLIAVAVICFLGAGVAIAMQLGLFGGGKPAEKVDMGPATVEETLTDKEKATYKKALEIQEEVTKRATKAGA